MLSSRILVSSGDGLGGVLMKAIVFRDRHLYVWPSSNHVVDSGSRLSRRSRSAVAPC